MEDKTQPDFLIELPGTTSPKDIAALLQALNQVEGIQAYGSSQRGIIEDVVPQIVEIAVGTAALKKISSDLKDILSNTNASFDEAEKIKNNLVKLLTALVKTYQEHKPGRNKKAKGEAFLVSGSDENKKLSLDSVSEEDIKKFVE